MTALSVSPDGAVLDRDVLTATTTPAPDPARALRHTALILAERIDATGSTGTLLTGPEADELEELAVEVIASRADMLGVVRTQHEQQCWQLEDGSGCDLCVGVHALRHDDALDELVKLLDRIAVSA